MKWILLLSLSLFLSVLQLRVSTKHSLLYQTEIELVEQQQRMNDYPSRYYRIANVIEKRPESRLFFRVQDNFFSIFDLKLLPFYLSPFVVFGFFVLIKKRSWGYLFSTLFVPVLALTYTGVSDSVSNFCLYPFIVISTAYAFLSLFEK